MRSLRLWLGCLLLVSTMQVRVKSQRRDDAVECLNRCRRPGPRTKLCAMDVDCRQFSSEKRRSWDREGVLDAEILSVSPLGPQLTSSSFELPACTSAQ